MKLTMFQSRMGDLGLKPHSRYLKPLLTNNTGKAARLRWAMRWVCPGAKGSSKFSWMGNIVHVDEDERRVWTLLYSVIARRF